MVRQASTSDAAAIAAFLQEAWRQYGPDAEGFAGATDEAIAEISDVRAIRNHLGGRDRRMFVAEDGGRVVGFAATREEEPGVAELAGVTVLRTSAGRGLGPRLVAAAIDQATVDGYSSMVVRTETTNRVARKLYEVCGFVTRSDTIEYVDDRPVEVWELTRPLP